jgi:hypothetical protein
MMVGFFVGFNKLAHGASCVEEAVLFKGVSHSYLYMTVGVAAERYFYIYRSFLFSN